MKENNNATYVIGGIIALLLVGGLIWAITGSMNNDNKDDNNTSSQEMKDQKKEADKMEEKDIVATAMATSDLSTLFTAVKAADLVETLQGEGPFTVLAPTNAAFDALPAGTLDDLLKPENKEKLAGILKYHVISGKVMSSDLKNGQTITTVNGQTLTVEINDDMVHFVDAQGTKAMVSQADVKAKNGVVHVIDAVLLPQ
jgi:uncharacterized surface protein with fasciclin (FAS1) repeats